MSKREELLSRLLDLLEDDKTPETKTPEEEEKVTEPPKQEEKEPETPKEEVKEKEVPKEPEEDDKSSEADELRREIYLTKAENALAQEFNSHSLDGEFLENIKGFLDYDKLANEKSELDSEKVKSLVSAIASVALGEPPKGEEEVDFINSRGGMAKYLD